MLALLLAMALAQAPITGIVKDSSGGAIPGASVVVRTDAGPVTQTVTGPDGRFAIDKAPDGRATLIVLAGGFAQKEVPVAAGEIEVILSPASLFEEVTVTPGRGELRLGDTPASVSVVSSQDIRESPALVADDVLRRIPTFSLFRRTSSLSSHPTAQGVSLRGIGPSGVSRTLVMVDGVPFNDAFGGWVYWTRVPMASLDRIEVVDGSSSSLYGNYAMGGVINIISGRATRRTVELKTQYGNRDSRKVDFFGSDVFGKLSVVVEGGAFNTDGFPIVIANERGVIDNEAWVHFRNINSKVDYRATDRVNLFFRGGYFSEDRSNAKIDEINDTRWKSVTGGVRVLMPDGSDLQARLFGDFAEFHSTFLAVPATTPPRNAVRLTLDQRVPADSWGGMVQWGRAFGRSHVISAGSDWRWVDGDSLEDAYNQVGAIVSPVTPAVLALRRESGGTQRSFGAYLQDVFTPVERLIVTVSARVDTWKNYDGHNLETNTATGLPVPIVIAPNGLITGNRPDLADKSDTAVSPRVAAMYHVSDRVRVWGGYSEGFRAPTLNELYRQFAVGLIRTFANEALSPERLRGFEAGVMAEAAPNVVVRGTFYDNRVKDPVANVTIGTNQLQRQNLGRTAVKGFQTDVDVTAGEFVRLSAGYLFNSAKVTEFSANPQLIGNYLPQVPKHRGSFQVTYANPRLFNAGLGVQYIGRQFDDDQNIRAVPGESEPGLPGYAIVDLTASRALQRNVEVFFGVQNLLDEEYIVQTLPTTVGSPRLVHAGVRVRFAGR